MDLDTLKRLREFADIDTTRDDFLNSFYVNFMKLFPEGAIVDKAYILKHIKEFYLSRGSSNSVKFLLRILYNQEIDDIYLPKQDVLKSSDGKWFVEKTLLVGDIRVNNVSNTLATTLDHFVSNKVVGLTSNAYALVEKVSSYYNQNILINELSISNKYKNFSGGEQLWALFEENGETKYLTANLFSGFINTVDILNRGTGYQIGDVVTVESNTGTGAEIVVSSVATGNVRSSYIATDHGGAGFQVNQQVFFSGGGGTGANGQVTVVLADGLTHPNSYVIAASVVSDESNTRLGNTTVVYETFAYQNLATQYVRSSNLTISTTTGSNTAKLNLSAWKANSNTFFETYDTLNVGNIFVLVTSSNTIANTVNVSPALPGGLIANSFQVIKKANSQTTITNAMVSFVYANTGPIDQVSITTQGTGYTGIPTALPQANTRVRSLGILGKMKIDRGGLGYAIGDTINITNVPFGYGTGAAANVTNVAANGMITQVKFVPVVGQRTGGTGYDMNFLPLATVTSANGTNAVIRVTSVLGANAEVTVLMNDAGAIQSLAIINKGAGYDTVPTLNLSNIGDGTAQAAATIITGEFSYPGRFLNDDGQVSGYNFIEDRDYYQNYSYVVKSRQSVENYRKSLNDLIHPAGMKLFAEYLYDNTGDNNDTSVQSVEGNTAFTYSGTYAATSNANGTVIRVTADGNTRNIYTMANLYLEFASGDTANLSNVVVTPNVVNASAFTVYIANVRNGTVSANSGNGNTYSLKGTSTTFRNSLSVGDQIRIGGWSNTFYVGAISNNDYLYVTSQLPPNITGNTYGKVYTPANSNGTIYFTSI